VTSPDAERARATAPADPAAERDAPATTATAPPYPEIGDYAAIGNCRALALVSRDGSIDWLCLPHFSSPSVFAAMLDRERGGRFMVRPRGGYRVDRGYVPGTNVLRTVFNCAEGRLELIDFLTVPAEHEAGALRPQHELARVLECTAGHVDYEVTYAPRPDYARRMPSLHRRGRLGWICTHRGQVYTLQSQIDLQPDDAGTLHGHGRLTCGERHRLLFAFCENDVAVFAPLASRVDDALDCTVNWWRRWIARCRYDGPSRDAVQRSALTLKLLTYGLSGAVIAAPTTSLPEDDVGERNWDYRYCWLRDTSLTLQSFMELGYDGESRAFLGWLLHATRLTHPRLQVLYDVHGEARLPEFELPHLSGWRGLGPVRVGNGAWGQLQLDVYGEMVLTAHNFAAAGGDLDDGELDAVRGYAESAMRLWNCPDDGIWEIRAGRRHNTYSKLMCWVALDRLLALHELKGLRIDAGRVARERSAIRADLDARGYDEELGGYVGYYGGTEPDASLLLLARHGYLDPRDPRMIGTCRMIERRLDCEGLVYRYPGGAGYDGLVSTENPFGICSFWLVEYLARAGEVERAIERFERLLGLSNDVGLYAEMFHREDGRPWGNFPQAFTHVGLVTAALAIERACGRLPESELAR
jgi:GH15 family glucan-1,4-alpha-glucosidase